MKPEKVRKRELIRLEFDFNHWHYVHEYRLSEHYSTERIVNSAICEHSRYGLFNISWQFAKTIFDLLNKEFPVLEKNIYFDDDGKPIFITPQCSNTIMDICDTLRGIYIGGDNFFLISIRKDCNTEIYLCDQFGEAYELIRRRYAKRLRKLYNRHYG